MQVHGTAFDVSESEDEEADAAPSEQPPVSSIETSEKAVQLARNLTSFYSDF